ncbi:MAG TPA: hypothetical protein DEG23_02490 [Coxiellaceae bacterium]|nr:hypothetical protein [Coxiellaceae bacterium]HBY55666.1 hypothetical protein [Coxiellaceae bacterium]
MTASISGFIAKVAGERSRVNKAKNVSANKELLFRIKTNLLKFKNIFCDLQLLIIKQISRFIIPASGD